MVKSKMSRLTAVLLSMIMILSSFSILTATQASAATDPERVHVDMYGTGIKWAKTVTFYEPLSAKNWISADTVTGGNVKFVNVKPQCVGLRIYKTFTDSEGESISVSNKIYNQVEFSVYDNKGNIVIASLNNSSNGTYTVYHGTASQQPTTVLKLGTSSKSITLTGLESGKTYTVKETIAGNDLKKICVCKSLFTVEVTKENAVIYAQDNSVVQSGKVTMPTGENSVAEIHFENTYKTTGLTIYKESDDDLVERQFAVTTTNYDLYPESDPLYVMSEVTTGADGKVRGIAKVNDLPLAYYDHDTDTIVNIQYKIEEVDTPEYYEIPAAQTIIPMNGQTSVTIKNKLKTGKIRIIKKAEINGSDEIIPLEGIEFSLKNSYNKTVLSAVTDANGEILFENLPIAVGVKNPDGSESVKKIRYTVSELAGKNNEKYVLADDQTVTLDYTKEANKRIKTLQIMNTPITGNVFLEKADERTLELLSGAEFTLYKDVNENGIYDKGTDTLAVGYTIDGDTYTPHHTLIEVTETTTDDEGNTTTKGTGRYELYSIEKGKYIVVETKTPVGYVDEHKEFSFEITYDQQTVPLYDEEAFTDIDNTELEIIEKHHYVYNTRICGDVYLYKSDADNRKRLSGAVFHIWADSDRDGKLNRKTDESIGIMKEIKDADGKGTGEYEMTDLPYGDYFVLETVAPEGYMKSKKTYAFSITENGVRVFVDDVLNPPIKGNVSVLKIDSLTKEQLKDAEFTVYNDVDRDGLITDGIDTVYAVMNHDDGYRYYLNDLPYGEYVLKETKAPVGHIMTKKIYPFQIIDNGVTVEIADDGEIGIMNEPIQGSIRIVKIDSKNQTPVEGAEFTLYDSNGNPVKVVTTDKDGIADFGQHRYGKYTVIETTAPEKYLADNTPIPFEILEHGKIYGYTHENTSIEGNIEIVKIDGRTQKPLAGAEFTLFDNTGNAVQVITTGKDVKAFFAEVPYGKYTVAETKAPKNCKKDSTPIPFEILEHGKTLTVTKKNKPEEGTGTFIKTSEDGIVKDVALHIYGKSNTGIEVDETVVTDENGSVSLSLLTGTYTVEEISVADRYVSPAKQTVTIKADKTSTVTFNNILKRGKVTTTKVDEEYPDNKLTGAVFEVYDADGQLVDKLKEVSEGVYELSELTTGNYTLKETKAPDGFDMDENAYPFEITENGDVRNIETLAGVGFINDAQKGNLVIHKRSSDKKLEGFSFRITGKAITGQEYDRTFTTDKDGIITISGLRIGTYTVSEIADEATERYILPDDQTVDIRSKEVTDVEFYNDERVIPFEIKKTDISTGELIPGCGFRIRNADGDIVIEGYTDENGIAKFELVCGDYTYQEFDAPEGYIINEKEYPFTINPDDTIVKAEMSNTGTGTIEITKTDISNGALSPDCGIEILDADKKVIRQGRTDKNGIIRFDVLPYGKYFYREFDAPEGYILDETPFEFEVKKNGEIIKANMTNKPVPEEKQPGYITTDTPKNPDKVITPQTGDDSNTMAAIISIICLISVSAIYFCRSRKKDDEN